MKERGCKGYTLVEVIVAGALAMLLFVLLMEIGWRIPATAGHLAEGLGEMTDLRGAAMLLTGDLRATTQIIEPDPGEGGEPSTGDAMVVMVPDGQITWTSSGGVLTRTAGETGRVWDNMEAGFSRHASGLVEATLLIPGRGRTLKVSVMVVEDQ